MESANPAPQTMQPMEGMPPTPRPDAPMKCGDGEAQKPNKVTCPTEVTKSRSPISVHINQFLLFSATSGPRGQTRVTGPGSYMLMYEKELSPRNSIRVDLMGSAEQLTVGTIGTPQLLQTENLDAMHAHDTVMALELRDTIKLGVSGRKELIFLFAPRGAAAVGPVPYMHRPSAEGNPDAPLGHNLQDGFHDVSTVFGAGFRTGRTFVEVTRFSGKSVSWPLPLHGPDSLGVRLTQGLTDHAEIGASYADVLTPDDNGGPSQHERFASAWLATNHKIYGSTLKSSVIWGQLRTSGGPSQNSFLAETVLQRRSDNIFGRAELLQATPEQLALTQTNGPKHARWVGAVTLGYERAVMKRGLLSLFAGTSITKDFAPRSFEGDYGRRLGGAKLFLRLKFDSATGMAPGM